MNRSEYIKALDRELKHLPMESRSEALSYFKEYFDDAGPENEQGVIEELGQPKDAAAQILKDTAMKRLEEPGKAAKKGLSTIWLVVLAICAVPVGLPIALMVILLGLSVFIVLLSISFAFGLTGIVFVASSVVCVVAGMMFLPSWPPDGLAVIGAGLVCMAVGVLCLLFTVVISRGGFGLMIRGTRSFLTGGKKHEKKLD